MKKLLATLACGALAFVCTAQPVNAAAAINPHEAELLALVEEGISMGGVHINYAPGSAEYDNLKAYLELGDIDITSAALADVKESMKNAQAFMNAYGAEDATPEMMAQFIGLIVPAAEALDLNMTYSPLTDGLMISDKSGNILFDVENVFDLMPGEGGTTPTKLENTGENFTSTYAIIGTLVVMLACAGYMTLKKKESLN